MPVARLFGMIVVLAGRYPMWSFKMFGSLNLGCVQRRNVFGSDGGIEFAHVAIFVGWHVSRQFGACPFLLKCLNDLFMDHFPTGRSDGMGDIRVQFSPPFLILDCRWLLQVRTTSIAVSGTKVIFTAALWTTSGKLSIRHGYKRTSVTFDDLHIADHESIIEILFSQSYRKDMM